MQDSRVQQILNVRLRRAGIVLASVQGRTAAEIAQMFAATDGYVREVIHAFNDTGFAALDPKWSGGRPRKFGPAARELICQTARSTPSALGQPFTTWSLTKLADYLTEDRHLPVSTPDRAAPSAPATPSPNGARTAASPSPSLSRNPRHPIAPPTLGS